jgi:hypothetical protein
MAVGKQSSTSVTVTYDDSAGAPQVITGFIMDLGGAEIEMELESSDSFGDAWREKTPTGMWTSPPIQVKGHFDTTATTGPHVVLRPVAADALPGAATRTLAIAFGDSKVFTVETRLNKYRVVPSNGKLTAFEATITPTGAAVWTP